MRVSDASLARTVLLIVAAGVCCGSVCVCRCPAAHGGYPAYCSTQPLLERAPGQTLYWHNPLERTVDPCETPLHCESVHRGMSPRWYASGEYLGLFRHQDRVPFQGLPGAGNDGIVLGTPDFDVEIGSGARVLIGRSLGEWYRIEGSYFGSYSWSDGVAIRNGDANDQGGTGMLFSPFSDFGTPDGVLGVDYNDFASIAFTSRLNSAEINFRRRLRHLFGGEHSGEASVIVGLRYMDISETFGYFTQANVPAPQGATNDVDISADNEMFGVQIGLLSQLLMRERAWIDFEVKGGFFTNRAGQQTVYTNVDSNGATTTATYSDREDVTSYVIDLALAINYQLAPSMTLRLGYNAIFVVDVALAAENMNTDVNTLLLGPADINHDNNLVYHGPSIGFIWTR